MVEIYLQGLQDMGTAGRIILKGILIKQEGCRNILLACFCEHGNGSSGFKKGV
jgi:hypothetical protein